MDFTSLFNEPKYDKETLKEIEPYDLEFKELDEILIEHKIPKDIGRIIYQYAKGSCNTCKECCELCNAYCLLGCLRIERDACCKWEFSREMDKYKQTIEDIIDNEDIRIIAEEHL